MCSQKKSSGLNRLFDLINKSQPVQQDQADDPPTAPEAGSTFLIVGLGNPGREYTDTRHNIGFMLVDHLANHLGLSFTRAQNKAAITDGRYNGHKLILIKPQTYMNESGRSVGPIAKYYKIPNKHILVAFDDMDLPLGTIRIRPKGSAGGQKGMVSIIQHLNGQNFPRIRLGLGRPPGRMDPAAYLLQDFRKGDLELVDIMLHIGKDAILEFVTNGLDAAMNKYNGNVS